MLSIDAEFDIFTICFQLDETIEAGLLVHVFWHMPLWQAEVSRARGEVGGNSHGEKTQESDDKEVAVAAHR